MVSSHRHQPKALNLPVQNNSSPIFPSDAFSPIDASFNIPQNEIINSGSTSLSIILAEPVLFLRGLTIRESAERLPSLLRGTLVVRVTKPSKIKTISLTFKGTARTEWPEGIPPKKSEYFESKDVHSHTWPFFNAMFPMSDYSSGANMVRNYRGHHKNSLSLDARPSIPTSPVSPVRTEASSERPDYRRTHHRTFSSPTNSAESTRGVRALAGKLRRAASPSPVSTTREAFFSSLNLGPHRSFSRDEAVEVETQSKGYRTFDPGEYFYNFELAIPQSLPESLENTYGSVSYALVATIERPGAFRSKISGSQAVTFVRCPADNNIEINEPIAISKAWEDQLYYEIVISGKAFPIGTRMPISFKFTPLAKIELHRIRVYITENSEYFCRNKKVHRMDPTKRFLLEELVSEHGPSGNLLLELEGGDADTTDLDLEPLIPETFPKRKDNLHPFSTYENIKVHHWVKIVLRISRSDPDPKAEPGKKKHFEISIDSPIHLLDAKCTNTNVYLPAYVDPVSRRTSVTSVQPVPFTPFPASASTDSPQRPAQPISVLRGQANPPPPFDADESPPVLSRIPSQEPPNYESVVLNESSYVKRYASYHETEGDAVLEASQRSVNTRSVRHLRSSLSLRTSNTDISSSGSIQSIPSQDSSSFTSLGPSSTNHASSTSRQNVVESISSTEITEESCSTNATSSNPAIMRLQNNHEQSTTSVDIVDQSSLAETQPSANANTSSIETASNIDENNLETAGERASTNDVPPTSDDNPYLGTSSMDLTPLLAAPTLSRVVSDDGSIHVNTGRGPLDSSADIGLLLGSEFEDDQESLASTPSLWI